MKPDSLYLKEIHANSHYDYMREIDADASTISEDVSSVGESVLDNIMEMLFNSSFSRYIGTLIIIALIIFIAWRMIKSLHLDKDSAKSEKGLGDDTIYGHSWSKEINGFMSEGNFSEVVVLTYLYWLSMLNDAGAITYNVSKTPGIYLKEVDDYCSNNPSIDVVSLDGVNREMQSAEVYAWLKQLTNHYLYVRYGHRKITVDTAKYIVNHG